MISFEDLRQVILENRSEVMKYNVVERDINLDGFHRQVLVGVRRAGKSFLLFGKIQKMIKEGKTWDDIVYVNFEDERLSGFSLTDLNKILEVQASLSQKKPALFLDEIQNVEGWEKFARRLADQKYEVYITGSNSKMLSREIASTLGGRYIEREVFPLSLREYMRIIGIDDTNPYLGYTTESRGTILHHLEEYFNYGGFPECALMGSKRDYLISLYQKIFLGDIAARHRIENIFALRILYKKIAESVKQPLSYSRATNIVASTGVKIGKSTIINYIEYAIDAYLILPITNYADKLVDKMTNKKYYFIDNGIISLLALDIRTTLLENIVALHLLRKYGTKDSVFFYRKEIEVDFYIPESNQAIQVSYNPDSTDATLEREIKGLVKINALLGSKENIIVTYNTEKELTKKDIKIRFIPLWKFLLEK